MRRALREPTHIVVRRLDEKVRDETLRFALKITVATPTRKKRHGMPGVRDVTAQPPSTGSA